MSFDLTILMNFSNCLKNVMSENGAKKNLKNLMKTSVKELGANFALVRFEAY
jgi:hypothetical protein